MDQDADGLCSHDKDGVTRIPIDQVALLMLGPGTVVSHAAMRALSENNCLVCWVGEQGVRLYAHSTGGTFSARRLQVQARLVSDDRERQAVARRMYMLRFPEPPPAQASIDQLRGMEGIRVRRSYEMLAEKYGVPWHGRVYDPDVWEAGDSINRALSTANACLYGLCHAAIVSVGLSPGLGFVHHGKMLSFVYDVADFYKTEVTLPIAFRFGALGPKDLESQVRRECRDVFHEHQLIRRILPDIEEVFGVGDLLGESPEDLEGSIVSLATRAKDRGLRGEPDGQSERRALDEN